LITPYEMRGGVRQAKKHKTITECSIITFNINSHENFKSTFQSFAQRSALSVSAFSAEPF
jgi:hypothetical protein